MSISRAAALASFVAAAFLSDLASATTITDTTLTVSYRGTAQVNYFAGHTQPRGDVIESGPYFDTQKVDVTISNYSVRFVYQTQFDGDHAGAHYADIFLATDPAHPDVFGYGIALGQQSANGGVAPGLYALAPDNYKTSMDIWSSRTNAIYGGKYVSPNDGLERNAPVVITGGSVMPGWTVSVSQSPSGDSSFPFLLDVKLTAPNPAAYFDVFSYFSLAAFWATADCNNDPIFTAVLPTSRAPEPGTILLLARGLVGGIAPLSRRKNAQPRHR